MAVDLQGFAFSFSHAIIKLNNNQYTAIESISYDQSLDRSAVYGTDVSPLKRTKGQLGLGEGTITFSDLEEAFRFMESLGDDPMGKTFEVSITLANEAGDTRSIELLSCALTGFGGDYSQGADALQQEIPFDYMRTKVNGKLLSVPRQ